MARNRMEGLAGKKTKEELDVIREREVMHLIRYWGYIAKVVLDARSGDPVHLAYDSAGNVLFLESEPGASVSDADKAVREEVQIPSEQMSRLGKRWKTRVRVH